MRLVDADEMINHLDLPVGSWAKGVIESWINHQPTIEVENKMKTKFVQIAETDNFIVEYAPDFGVYRVSYFKDNHFVDDCVFDSYEATIDAYKTVMEE